MTESSRSKTLEVMRNGIAAHFGEVISPFGLSEIAEAALTAYESHLQAEGMAVVPVEPSAAMLHAGSATYDHPSVYMGGPSEGGKRLSARIWRSMLKAAASPYGKAVVKEASAEARRAVANSNPVKERDDE